MAASRWPDDSGTSTLTCQQILLSDHHRLPVSEDILHVYGYLPSEALRLLHPRPLSAHWQAFVQPYRTLRAAVLRLVRVRPQNLASR